jgi:hypothetical protein
MEIYVMGGIDNGWPRVSLIECSATIKSAVKCDNYRFHLQAILGSYSYA